MAPEVGRSRPASRFRKVDFPDPELPRRARNSPARMSRETSFTAVMTASPSRYCRETFWAWIKGCSESWPGVWLDGIVSTIVIRLGGPEYFEGPEAPFSRV